MKTGLRAIHLGFWLLVIALFCGQNAYALPVARLKNVQPRVEIQNGRTKPFQVAFERGSLDFGDTVRTSGSGKAGIWFANGTKAFLSGPNARLQIVAPASPSSPLTLRISGALSRVFVRPKGLTTVQTAAAIAAAPGTEYLLEMPSENTTIVTVIEGTVELFNSQGRVVVGEGQQSRARVGGAPTPPVAVDVTGLLAWTADISGLPVEWETPFVSFDPNSVKSRLQIAQSATNRAQKLQLLGEAHYDGGDYAASVAQFSELVIFAPENARAQLSLGRARQARGDLPGAISAFQSAQTLAPDDPAPRVGEALALLSDPAFSRPDEAARSEARQKREAARAVLAPVAQNASAQAVLGLLELRETNLIGATEFLEKAIATDSSLAPAHALLALAYLTQNQLPQAEKAAEQAVSLAPASAQAQGTLSTVFFFQKRLAPATAAARRAVALNPYSPFALLAQGRVFGAQNRLALARDALQQAQTLAPDLPLLPLELGAIYARLDRLPQAEILLRRAVQLMPSSPEAHTNLGVVLNRQGRTEAALAQHEEALRLDANSVSARVNLATLFLEQGRLEEAREQAEQGQSADPTRGLLFVRLSEITLLARQDVLEAETLARRGVEILPASALAHYQLGRVFLEQNRFVQAEEEFRQAATLDPQFADSRFALGFTKALTAPREAILPSPGATDLGSIARVISLLNLQSAGNPERIQAAIQDPTVFRVASRAYGDTQIDTLAGESGTRLGRLSFLQESPNRRGETGIVAEREQGDGVRTNADQTTDRVSAISGKKSSDGPSGWLFLGQFARQKKGLNGLDVGGLSDIATARRETETPLLLAAYNRAFDDTKRTRALVQFSRPESRFRGLQFDAEARQDLGNLSLEVRHDRQIGASQRLSAGFSLGRNRFDQELQLLPPIPAGPTFLSRFAIQTRTAQAYLRDEWKVSERLSLTGELGYQSARATGRFSVLDANQTPLSVTGDRLGKDAVLPLLVMSYRPDARSSLRFRARRVFGGVSEFGLLAPLDDWAVSTRDLPDLALSGTGRSYELEYDRTLGNAAFLRLSVFDQHLRGAQDALLNAIPRARQNGARLNYSGRISRQTAFFANARFNRATSETENRATDNVPRWAGEIGLQTLSHRGWFVQPSALYSGNRPITLSDASRSRLGGFSLWNLQIGKRRGLRSLVSVEISNLFDKKTAVFAPELRQPGRRFRLGITQRF